MLLIPPLQMMQSQLLGLGGAMDAGGLQRLKEKEQPPGDYQALQARIMQLEGQVGFKQEASTVCFNILTRAASPVCYCPGEDPAAGTRPEPDAAGKHPAAA